MRLWTEESNFPQNLYVINANLRLLLLLLVIIRGVAEELLRGEKRGRITSLVDHYYYY